MLSNECVISSNDFQNNSNNINNINIDSYYIESHNRTNDCRMDSIPNKCEMENEITTININNANIFRYKFTQEFMDELYKFSKIHQYDHRKDFKEAWEKWAEENDEIISLEIRRLENLGYDGDILNKMFKSARYYYRKKSTEKKAPKQRRVYVGLQKELLENMDEHISNNYSEKDFKPSIGFDKFCLENLDLLKTEINRLVKNGINDSEEIKNKIKKTYKNRYFMIINK
jgi:hypothetical protein